MTHEVTPLEDTDDQDIQNKNIVEILNLDDESDDDGNDEDEMNSTQIRNSLKEYFSNEGAVSFQDKYI